MSNLITDQNVSWIAKSVNPGGLYTIVSPTSSGKTTKIPLGMVRSKGGKFNNVLVSLPTRIATTGAYDFVSKSEAARGVNIGYIIRGESIIPKGGDCIIYATSGSVLNTMYDLYTDQGPSAAPNTVIIIDEVHTGSIENTLIMALWLDIKAFYRQSPSYVPALVLMTATEMSFDWLGKPEFLSPPAAERNVKTIFINDNPFDTPIDEPPTTSTAVPSMRGRKKGRGRGRTNTSTPSSKLMKLGTYEAMTEVICGINARAEVHGHTLCWVPGKRAASKLKKLVDSALEKRMLTSRTVVYVVHGDSDSSVIYKIMNHQGNKKMIIIATNVAESSVTIKGVVYGVDSMLQKTPGVTADNENTLTEGPVSKNSSIQRMGRLAREDTNFGGEYYSMIRDWEYPLLSPTKEEDIFIIPIHHEVLRLLSRGLAPTVILGRIGRGTKAELLRTKIRKTNNELVAMRMIERVGNEVFRITPRGEFAGRNPQRVHSSSFVLDWVRRYSSGDRNLYACSVISCIIDMDIDRLISVPPDANDDYIRIKLRNMMSGDSLATILTLWNSMLEHNSKMFVRFDEALARWCINNSLSLRTVEELVNAIIVSMRVVGELATEEVRPGYIDVVDVMKMCIPIIRSVFASWVMVNNFGVYERQDNGKQYSIRSNIPHDESKMGTDRIICLSSIQSVTTSKKVFNNISLFTYTDFIEARYRGSDIMIPKVSREQLYRSFPVFGSTVIRQTEVDDGYVRLKHIPPEQLGLGIGLTVPEPMRLKGSQDFYEVLEKEKLISECLLPPCFMRPTVREKIRHKHEPKSIVSDIEDEELLAMFKEMRELSEMLRITREDEYVLPDEISIIGNMNYVPVSHAGDISNLRTWYDL